MFFASRPIIRPRKGVSEVMGALLLIVVVVVAVATLASFVSIAETNANNRQSYLTNIKNEDLQIVSAQFFQSAYSANTWSSVLLSIRNTNTQPSGVSQIKVGPGWVSNWEQIGSAQNPVITTTITGTSTITTSTTTITETSTTISTSATSTGTPYGRGIPSTMIIPAKAIVYVYIDFTNDFPGGAISPPLQTDQSIPITLLTVMGNFFTTVYNPPTPVAHASITSISYQDYNRDVVSLDGSQSTAANQSTIVSYAWNILVPEAETTDGCTIAAFSNTQEYTSVQVAGKTTQFLQESIPNLIGSNPSYCLTGPFEVSLTVTDSMGFIGTSSPIIVASDPNMAPIATFSASLINTSNSGNSTCTTAPCVVLGTVATIFGTPPPPNTYVTILYGGISVLVPVPVTTGNYWTSDIASLSSLCAITTTSTTTTTMTTTLGTGGTVQVSVNTLPSQILQCPTA